MKTLLKVLLVGVVALGVLEAPVAAVQAAAIVMIGTLGALFGDDRSVVEAVWNSRGCDSCLPFNFHAWVGFGPDFPQPSLVMAPIFFGAASLLAKLADRIEKGEERRQGAKAAEKARRQAAEAAEKARRQAAEAAETVRRQEQQGYRNRMIALGEESLVIFESLPNHLRFSEEYLDQAEAEFADGTFAPFWDCIENAAKALGRFDAGIRQIGRNSSEYDTLIQKYEGAPPRFPLAHESVTKLAIAMTSVKRMQAIVRKAQRDFRFATIYEQRKTNQILVAGFTNLAQALRDMSWQIAASIDNLAQSVDGMTSTLHESLDSIHSRLGEVVETASRHADQSSEAATQASMREGKVFEMLDNIQHRRRPFP